MTTHFALPSEKLKPFIKQYWAIENVLQKEELCIQRIVPCGLPELFFYATPVPAVNDSNKNFPEKLFISGQQKNHYDILINKEISLFSIVFQPEGLRQFFSLPVNQLFNLNVSLHDIDKKLYRDIESRLSEAVSFEEKVKIIEIYFSALLEKNYRDYEFKRVWHVMNCVKKYHGNIKIDLLASEACLSRKQFERVFSESVGESPKQYLNTIRFQYAIYQKSRNRELSITALAYDCGYFDQAHLINEFKTMSGLTQNNFLPKETLFPIFSNTNSFGYKKALFLSLIFLYKLRSFRAETTTEIPLYYPQLLLPDV